MKDLIAIVTCPERPNYLGATMHAVDQEGGESIRDKFVFLDGKLDDKSESLIVVCRTDDVSCMPWNFVFKEDGPSGTRRMLWWTLEQALKFNPDRILYLEDDIMLAEDGITRMLSCGVSSNHAFTTFCDWKEFPASDSPEGYHSVPVMGRDGRGLHGAQALLIPARTAEWVVKHGIPSDNPFNDGIHYGDCTFSFALSRSPWKQMHVHVPSLVDHIGHISLAHPRHRIEPGKRGSPTFRKSAG